MSDRRLLLVPGLSSPNAERYRPVYELLKEQSAKWGYRSCEVILLPGQKAEGVGPVGLLSLDGATARIQGRIQELEKRGDRYRLLGISFGATAALTAVAELGCLAGLERVVIWGPIPLWLSWQAFIGRVGREKLAIDTQLICEPEFFQQLKPVEYLLSRQSQPTLIAAGSADPYCPHYYIDYLRQLAEAAHLEKVEFRKISGCGHNVKQGTDPNWPEYIATVLG